MSIRCGNFKLIYESVTMQGIDPSDLSLSADSIRQYLATHPFPEDPAYKAEDFIHDVTQSSGFYCLPEDTKSETGDFIADCIQELMS